VEVSGEVPLGSRPGDTTGVVPRVYRDALDRNAARPSGTDEEKP
jgi:hypothetical protein